MVCKIRPWQKEDAADLSAALNNPKVLENLRDGLPYPYTEADALDYITAMLSADPNDTFAFAITVDGKVVGSIGAFRQQNIHSQTAEMGYYVAEPYWGKGVGTEAVRQTCKYVFEHTNILRIFAEPFSFNKGSRRILEKNGFVFEGILRQNAVKNGRVIDMTMYSLLKEEFGK